MPKGGVCVDKGFHVQLSVEVIVDDAVRMTVDRGEEWMSKPLRVG